MLLAFDGAAVLSEVKMAGDKFMSTALVQLSYYAAAMTSQSQRSRIRRWFPIIDKEELWLSIIAETRDEHSSTERGFRDDTDSTIQFLESPPARQAFSPYFSGIFVITIDSSYRAIDERCIRWSEPPITS